MRSSLLALSIVVGVAVCSCGGSGGSSPNPTTVTLAPAPTATTIDIVGQRGAQSFSPNPAAVNQGTMFVWRNMDSRLHHIVLNDGSVDSGDIAPGASSPALRLGTDGANYHCTIHPDMVGSINRSGGGPPPCEGPYC